MTLKLFLVRAFSAVILLYTIFWRFTSDIWYIQFFALVIFGASTFWTIHATTRRYNLSSRLVLFICYGLIGFCGSLIIFYVFSGELFEFYGSDSRAYYRWSQETLNHQFLRGLDLFLQNNKNLTLDDLGQVSYLSIVFRISNSILFQRAVNLVVFILTFIFLYNFNRDYFTSKTSMIIVILALVNGISLYYASSGLKEMLFFLVILGSIYSYNKFEQSGRNIFIFYALFFLFSTLFFRIATFFMLMASLGVVLGLYGNKIIRYILLITLVYAGALVLSLYSPKLIMLFSSDNLESSIMQARLGSLYKPFIIISGIVGPFPSIQPNALNAASAFWAPTLVVKNLLGFRFTLGMLNLLKRGNPVLQAICIFILINLVALIFINQTLKVRYFIPFLPFYYMIALSTFEPRLLSVRVRRLIRFEPVYVIVVVLLIVGWNLLR